MILGPSDALHSIELCCSEDDVLNEVGSSRYLRTGPPSEDVS